MLPLAITCGDPAGVGPLVLEQWWRGVPAAERGGFRFFGPPEWLDRLGLPGEPAGPSGVLPRPGEPTEAGARLALDALEAAAAACSGGDCAAVVTAPVSKAWLQRVGYRYPGQTEFFAARWGGLPTMAFCGGRLRVVLATWHEPLMQVGPLLEKDPELLARAVERAEILARAFGADPARIAVCGLNPHAGEGGLLGREERGFLDPQLERLRKRHPGLSPCLPGDTVFWRSLQGEFDVVVALYHDQGLGPLKTLEFEQAVNVTLGLPWIRTSPDHGTAYRLAAVGAPVDSRSFAQAVSVARQLALHTCMEA